MLVIRIGGWHSMIYEAVMATVVKYAYSTVQAHSAHGLHYFTSYSSEERVGVK